MAEKYSVFERSFGYVLKGEPEYTECRNVYTAVRGHAGVLVFLEKLREDVVKAGKTKEVEEIDDFMKYMKGNFFAIQDPFTAMTSEDMKHYKETGIPTVKLEAFKHLIRGTKYYESTQQNMCYVHIDYTCDSFIYINPDFVKMCREIRHTA